MTHRVIRALSLTLFLVLLGCECLFAVQQEAQEASKPTSSAQATGSQEKDETAPQEKKDEVKQGTQPSKTEEAGKPDGAKTEPTKDGKAEKSEKTKTPEPVVASPKLIMVQPDDTTYTPRPKTPAIFVFKNGDKIESDDFLITREAVSIVKAGKKTTYPISAIDQEATRAANEGRGVSVVFPKSKSEFNLDF